jgi:serine/threonine protein kinase
MLFAVSRFSVKIDGVRSFTFEEMATATNNFDISAQVGQGGYGKVYKGIVADGAIVAIKRAHEDSLQGSKEFCTEIELLSRLHHRNLVSLVGYCDEEDEQVKFFNCNYICRIYIFVSIAELLIQIVFCRCWFMNSCQMELYVIIFLVSNWRVDCQTLNIFSLLC